MNGLPRLMHCTQQYPDEPFVDEVRLHRLVFHVDGVELWAVYFEVPPLFSIDVTAVNYSSLEEHFHPLQRREVLASEQIQVACQ